MGTIIFSLLINLVLMVVSVQATTHIVGGSSGWSPTSDVLGWASRKTFSVGNKLVFMYGPNHGVAVVTENDYDNCNTNSPISSHSGGKTTITIDQEGPSYFICPTPGHCQGGMKLSINTMFGSGSGSDPDPGSETGIPTIPVRDPHSPHGGVFSPPKGSIPFPPGFFYSPPSPPIVGLMYNPMSDQPYCNEYNGGQGCPRGEVNEKLTGGLVLWFSLAAAFLAGLLVF